MKPAPSVLSPTIPSCVNSNVFTAPAASHEDTFAKDPADVPARAYDLILNGTELGGGSIRIHSSDVQKRVFDVIGLNRYYGWYEYTGDLVSAEKRLEEEMIEWEDKFKRPLLMLAGGTGLAPFLSMLGRIAQTGSVHPIHMIYGVTNEADLVEVEALQEFTRRVPGFTFACCVADEGSVHPRKGYVTHHIEPGHLNGGDVDVYLCGPPPMVDAVRHYLAEQAVSPANFYFEKFSPSGAVTAVGETHRAA